MGCLFGKNDSEGKYTYLNGDLYIGPIKNNLPNGKGRKFYGNSSQVKYYGDFVNGLAEGEGQYFFENGEYYTGHWKNDKKEGQGAIYFSNGYMKLKGLFSNDQFIDNNNNNINTPVGGEGNPGNNTNQIKSDNEYIYQTIY